MKINENYSGFILLREEYIDEVSGTARFFRHEKTGAQLVYISNTDDNKVFQVGFRTPSHNSTGVAHILEHSVLCGSAKYPVKEPFVELAKGSLNTFLNAMTYPDKTVYPIASTNDTDFMNLMDVYLDAVFNPSIYDIKEIFMQEGWHYHLEKPEDALTYNGVVYNEMKGVYSSPEEILQNELMKALYPDTIYGCESGGHPDHIPDLDYQAFLDFHRTFYHPSNAYIYFYGDGDVEAHLAYLQENYLAAYEALAIDSAIAIQAAPESHEAATVGYPVVAGDPVADKDYLAIGYVMESAVDFADLLAMDVLGHILMGSNSAPLKKALLDLKLCKDVDYSFTTSIQQPFFQIVLKETDRSQRQLVLTTIRETLEGLVEKGLDPKDVEAGINSAEFTLKEGEFGIYPRGLIYGLEMMDTWLYGEDPFTHLKYTKAIALLRESSSHRGFEGMIDRYLLCNPHWAAVAITPDPVLAEKAARDLAQKLSDYKASLDEPALEGLMEATQALQARQNREDTPEELATIPKLTLDEIGKEARRIPLEEEEYEGVKVLWHPGDTHGIVYLKFCFDLHTVPQEDLVFLSLVNKFLGRLATENYSEEALNQAIEIHTGGIATSIETFDNTKVPGAYDAKFIIKGKAVTQNVGKLAALMEEISLRTRFDDERSIGDILGEVKMARKEKILTAGHVVSTQRLQSYYSQSAALFERVGGLAFYDFLVDLDAQLDQRSEALQAKLKEVFSRIFNRAQVMMTLTSSPEDHDAALKAAGQYLSALEDREPELYDYHFPLEVKNEGFKTMAKIQYVSKGFNIRSLGYDYSGGLMVLKSILSMDYLWNRVRVQGGAYGASFGVSRSGDLHFASYRDPNLGKTLEVYDQAWEYIDGLDLTQRELEKYIIGTISGKDTPLSAALLGDAADTMYFNHTTAADLQRERDEILSATVGGLKQNAQMVREAMEKNILCVIGGEEAVEAEAQRFKEVKGIK